MTSSNTSSSKDLVQLFRNLKPIQLDPISHPSEWSLVEIQGTLELDSGSKKLDGSQFGRYALSSTGTPLLIIGNYILEGKIHKLQSPLAILSKTQATMKNVHLETPSGIDDTEIKSIPVVGVIRTKIIFNSRPRPIIV